MGSRRLLLLFVLALAAVGAFLLIELPQRRAQERERARAVRPFSFDPGAIDEIFVARAGTTLHFALAGTHWSMLAPVRDDAEASAVAPIIANIAEAEALRDLGMPGDLARFGLAPPAATVSLLATGDTAAVLEVGNPAVDRSAVYARVRGGPVLLLPTGVQRAVMLSADDYRNRRVIVFDLSAVRAFEIASPAGSPSAWRRGAGESWFTVVDGDTVPGDSIAVPAVLRRLRGMRVRSFVPGEGPPAGLPLVSVTIHKDDGSSQAVHFARVSPDVCHARVDGNPRTVEVADDPGDIALASVASLRDRRVLHFDPARAARISVTTPDTSAVLVRAGDAWAHPNPALGTIDRERAADFVRALRGLRYARPAAPGAGDPAQDASFSLVIAGAGDTILDELYCAPASGGVWLARSRSLGGVYEIDAGALDEIAARLSRLRR